MSVSETNPDWDRAADEFCQAWSSDVGRPDYARLADFYAPDPDVVIYDSLAPLAGFRGFEQNAREHLPRTRDHRRPEGGYRIVHEHPSCTSTRPPFTISSTGDASIPSGFVGEARF